MPIRVLLVDDSAVVRGLMNKALIAHADIEVIGTAANGAMAINMAERDRPDIIILDIEMPVMDGITALPELLKVSPNTKIIMASTLTHRNAEISLNALSMGASDYLAKPSSKLGKEVDEFYRELIDKVLALGGTAVQKAPKQTPPAAPANMAKPALKPAIVAASPPAASSALGAGTGMICCWVGTWASALWKRE